MIEPKLTLIKIEDKNNLVEHDKVEILEFNYDGKGRALAFISNKMVSMSDIDIDSFFNDDKPPIYRIQTSFVEDIVVGELYLDTLSNCEGKVVSLGDGHTVSFVKKESNEEIKIDGRFLRKL